MHDADVMVLERLLTDERFRVRFRRTPAAVLREAGLEVLARDLDGDATALQTLEVRESRSSLAGLFMAAAAEGAGLLDLVAHRPDHFQGQADQAMRRTLARPRVQALTRQLAVANNRPRSATFPAAGGTRTRSGGVAATAPEPTRGAVVDIAADGYPGDDAGQAAIGAWMAQAAKRAGLPPELPVMAALVESDLQNLAGGDADSAGFFQMRVSLWDSGRYAGYRDRPELQLQWFIEQAEAVLAKDPSLRRDPSRWGEWVADIERPAAQYRGRYAQRLEQARGLLGDAPRPADRRQTSAAGFAPPAARSRRSSAFDAPARGTADAAADAAGASRPPLGRRLVELAARELGEAEDPPGTNDSARITEFRTATPGGPVGPWCAYFVSWVARRAGVPLGDAKQGFANVDALWSWAEASGRATETPRPGDLIVWDEHVGLVERVDPDGTIHTIEGNSSDQVARRVHSPAGVVGFVRLG